MAVDVALCMFTCHENSVTFRAIPITIIILQFQKLTAVFSTALYMKQNIAKILYDLDGS